MTGAIAIGTAYQNHLYLDGRNYGQKSCQPMEAPEYHRMQADARLIAAAPEMYARLKECVERLDAIRKEHDGLGAYEYSHAAALLAKIEGK